MVHEDVKGSTFPIFFHIEHNVNLECGPIFADVIVINRELVKVFPGVGETIILVPVLREYSLLVAWTQQLVLPATDDFLLTLARTVSDSGFILSMSCSTDRYLANTRKDFWKTQKTAHDLTQFETLTTTLKILDANVWRLYRNRLTSTGLDLKEINSDFAEAGIESDEAILEKLEKFQELVDSKTNESDFDIISTKIAVEAPETG
ncbi:hypothetical protein AAHC03_05584 [Spirometra sp. Aus1]